METSIGRDKFISMSRSRSGSQKYSIQRSLSRGQSGSRRSFTLSSNGFGMPVSINFHMDEEQEQNTEMYEKPKEVSIRRLAYLNMPELPVLLLGSLAASIHGMVFPVFGLLLSKALSMFYEPPEKMQKDSNFWAVVYLGFGFITFTALPLQKYLFVVAGGKLIERVRSKTFEKVLHQEISWFDHPANSRCEEFRSSKFMACLRNF